ncbi:MAG TPA: aminotransferase class I/II-fold pyridoxal phosphate-dependent enzyme [Methanomassiliicoccales archaeon]|nr:aminotransferase class I/II-fold pyridoxal phosphate-dependent enzyme [Methanomassiliicoccales archaeon]
MSDSAKDKRGRGTKAVHAGELLDKEHGSVNTPIYQTSTFYYPTSDPRTWEGITPEGTYIYTRHGNPTIHAAEEKLAALERAESGLVFSSGMAAITSTILSIVGAGDHVVAIEDLYGGTFNFIKHELPRLGVEVTMTPAGDIQAMEKAITKRTKLLYIESPTNPLLRLVDIHQVAEVGRRYGVLSMIDSTFATPINQNPIELGIDLVAHSCTKYLNGHSDLIAGAVVGRKELIQPIEKKRILYGGSIDPVGAFLLIRGMKTLHVRMDRHNHNAMEVASFLATHPKVAAVHYPGLESHPQHALAKRQMRGYSGMVSFEVAGGRKEAEATLEHFKIIKKATSLGGVDSLASMPLNSSHSGLSPQERAKFGIKDSLIRLSVGIEDIEDLKWDLDQALTGKG